MSSSGQSKFPDIVPRTKILYDGHHTRLHLRHCTLSVRGGEQYRFENGVIRIGAMDDNDVVLRDETVSRYHCQIVQEDTGYVLMDLDSTNGTFVNSVRIREAFLHPGCSLTVGGCKLDFQARDEEVAIVPSRADRCGSLVGGSAKMREMYAILERIAPTNTTVVIEGETGTGKEVVAKTLHELSPRADKELVVFDCSAVPPNLVESELFGHEKGSFTGAVMSRPGLFEMADGGTLFLDELGELPLDLQPKLLRVLESRVVRRVGSSKAAKVDVRIIAATNRDLKTEVRERRFRKDLYYRLSVVKLQLPPLRERSDDLPLLCEHLLARGAYNRTPDGTQRVSRISADAMASLQAYQWPGNVRELINVLERAVSLCHGTRIEVDDLPEHIGAASGARRRARSRAGTAALVHDGGFSPRSNPRPPSELFHDGVTFKDAKEQWVSTFERDYIVSLLERHGGNISHASKEADIDRKYFRKLMKKYDIDASAIAAAAAASTE